MSKLKAVWNYIRRHKYLITILAFLLIIGVLDEESYRRLLWRHRPLTDFWRIGRGTAERLARIGVFTMEEVAAADERVLYKLFGVDAELLIDHAWGREPVTMADI